MQSPSIYIIIWHFLKHDSVLSSYALVLSFIWQAMGEMVLCKVEKAIYSKEERNILEEEFGAKKVTCSNRSCRNQRSQPHI